MKNKRSILNSVGGKVLAIFILVSIATIASLTIVSAYMASKSLRQNAFNQLEAVEMIKKSQIESYFQERLADAKVFEAMPFIERAIVELDELSNEAKGNGYMGKKLLDYAPFKEAFDKYYPFVKHYLEQYGYYDVFLFSPNSGRVLLTVALEDDFATELKSETTHLAKAWQFMKENKKTVMTDIEKYAPSNDAPAIFIVEPAFVNGNYIGSIGLQLPLKTINKIMQERDGMGETGETYLVGPDKLMRSDSYLDPTNRSVEASLKGTVEKNGVDTEAVREGLKGNGGEKIIIDYNGNPVLSAWDPVKVGEHTWIILAELDKAEMDKPIFALVKLIAGIAIAVLAIVIIISILFSRSISRPLLEVVKVGEQISLGDFPDDNIKIKSKDEVGMVGEIFNKVVNSLKDKGKELARIADGDLTVEVKYASEKDQFAMGFDKMLSALNDSLAQVNSAVEQTASGSNQVAQASQSLSQGATEQASSLEEITSSITEISSQAKQNAENAIQASGLAKQAMENAENGNRQMQELVVAMSDINKSADMIKKIVKVIDDIAFQTNLLALNANVEAARAGKYGKGFAVVAEEVRNLAGRSAESVNETTQMVEEAIKNIMNGNKLVDITAKQLTDIMEGANKVADLVVEISTASKEQTQGLDQITQGLGQIDQVTQSNTANAEESASAAEELAGQAQQLRAIVSRFKLSEKNLKYIEEKTEEPSHMMKKIRENIALNDDKTSHIAILQEMNKKRKDAKTGVKNDALKPPKDVIKLDDEDFGKF